MKSRYLTAIHPGEILFHDFMEPPGLTQYALTKPGWWLNLQMHYDLGTAADKPGTGIARAVKPCALRPIPDLLPA
jgi:plasmid maintenance system antidote protein VapI